jgi:hypothetical protein
METYTKDMRWKYKALEFYLEVKNPELWLQCPNCKLIPVEWIYDNGRFTACGCGSDNYNHFTVRAESIMSYGKRNNWNFLEYNNNELRDNWNHWVKTGEKVFPDKGTTDKW